MSKTDQTDRLIEAIDKLSFIIDNSKQDKDYSQYFFDITMALKEIGNGSKNDGCLNKIHKEIRILNKTIIMAALLISATKQPEKTLNEYQKIIEQYLD